MSQHALEAGNESDGLWLPLTEYAVRSGVSTSTIRRKIKSNSILYRQEKGRYLILFNEQNNALARQPSMVPELRLAEVPQPSEGSPEHSSPNLASSPSEGERWLLPLMEKAVQMVGGAFEHTLKEKDERITLLEKRNRELEERLAELRTLVHALEQKYKVRY